MCVVWNLVALLRRRSRGALPVLWQGRIGVGMLRLGRRGLLLLMLLLVVLVLMLMLVHDARGARVLQMLRWWRTLLRVVGMMLHWGRGSAGEAKDEM